MTRARRAGRPGPAPLRDEEYPCGLPNLSETNHKKLEEGNHFAAISALGLEVGALGGAFGVLENPWRSFLWRQPRVERTLENLRFKDVILDFCQYGTAWQKRTRLRGDLPGLERLQRL